ncbi:hypothetical protein JQC67_11660 [Aurantibacter crassamenti]|uniref:hypothetical protein n=1 Tax=Aurantibacter crassamenti TaxID=1837375 RepID=UPI001939850D|nr:hypothetical protein [Aurantibacter crassamenti]MBM1106798.1 hypothetical protein [Aurantibacter crassamenti]
MIIKELIGDFDILGKNQDAEGSAYKGSLNLSLDVNGRIVAVWTIGKNESQHGTGFFKDNILVINFNYIGANDQIYKGVVVYRCLTKDILEGFWSEKHGNPLYLGTENCFRRNENTSGIH